MLLRLGCFILLYLSLGSVALSQTSYTVFGVVTNADDEPVADIVIEVLDVDGLVVETGATHADGQYSLTFSVTAIQPGDDTIPTHLSIETVWPNPSAQAVQGKFSVAEPGAYLMEVFDILGRRVSVARYHLQPGTGVFQVQRSGADGMYLVRISGSGAVATRKITLIGGSVVGASPVVSLMSFTASHPPSVADLPTSLSGAPWYRLRTQATPWYESLQVTLAEPAPNQGMIEQNLTLIDTFFDYTVSGSVTGELSGEGLSGVLLKDFGGGYSFLTNFDDGFFSVGGSVPVRVSSGLSDVSFMAQSPGYNSKVLSTSFSNDMSGLDFVLSEVLSNYVFSGGVQNVVGEGLEGVGVRLKDSDFNVLGEVSSGVGGFYSIGFDGLPSSSGGFWLKTLENDFYESDSLFVSTGFSGGSFEGLNFEVEDKFFDYSVSGSVVSGLDGSNLSGVFFKDFDGSGFVEVGEFQNGSVNFEGSVPVRIASGLEDVSFGAQSPNHSFGSKSVAFSSSMDFNELVLDSDFSNYVFSGSVQNIVSDGLEGVEIRLKDSDMNILASTNSGVGGEFILSGVNNANNFYLKAVGNDLYQSKLKEVVGGVDGVNIVDLTLEDVLLSGSLSGVVSNQRNQGVQGVSFSSDIGSFSSSSGGGFNFSYDFPARLSGDEFSVLAQKEGYDSKSFSGFLGDLSLDVDLDKVLTQNNFVLDFTDVNGDLLEEGTSIRLSYLNESGSDSSFVDVTPGIGERLSSVSFSNWPGEDFVMKRVSGPYLDTILGRFDDQKFYEMNMFQNKSPDLPVIVPQSVINSEGFARVYLIPSTGSRTVVIGGQPVEQFVDMDWLLDETVRAVPFPLGSVKPFSPSHYGVSLPEGADWEVAIPGFAWGSNGIVPGPGKVEEVYDIASDIYSSYTLNDGTVIFNPVINIYESSNDPGWQDIENRGLTNTHIINRSSNFIPGNQKVYKSINDSWYLRAGRSLFNNNANILDIMEEIFEVPTASDETQGQRWYRSRDGPDEDTYFNNIGRMIARTLILSDPQTFYLPLNTTSTVN